MLDKLTEAVEHLATNKQVVKTAEVKEASEDVMKSSKEGTVCFADMVRELNTIHSSKKVTSP